MYRHRGCETSHKKFDQPAPAVSVDLVCCEEIGTTLAGPGRKIQKQMRFGKKILSHSQLPGSYPKSLWGSLAPNQSQAMRICWRPCGMGPCPENMIQRKWFHSNFQGLIQNPFGVLQHQIKMRPWESVEDPVEWVPALKIWFKENSFIPTSRAQFKIFLGFGSTKS